MAQSGTVGGGVMLHVPSKQTEDQQVEALASSFRPCSGRCVYRPLFGIDMMGKRLPDNSGMGEVEHATSGLTFANAVRLKNWVFALGRPIVGAGDWTVCAFNNTGPEGIHMFPSTYKDAPGDNGTVRGQMFMMLIISKAIPIFYPKVLELAADKNGQADFQWRPVRL